MALCFVGVGSNLGNRRKNIALAVKAVNSLKGTKIIKVSRIIESKPQGGGAHQPKFLNACLKLHTSFTPKAFLKKLKSIELALGRKKAVRFGPRVIDLDILFYEDKVIESKELTVPHPRIFERGFVLKPLLEVL